MKKLVIMAGGKSQRMGQDKVFLRVNDEETFLEHIFNNGARVFGEIFISTDTEEHADQIRNLPALKNLSHDHIIYDSYPMHGPIGGFVSVFEQTNLEKFAVLPTDVPFADMGVIETLWELCVDKPCVYKRDNDDLEPLIGAYTIECLKVFKDRLNENRNSLFKALEINGFNSFYERDLVEINSKLKVVDFDKAFRNINFPEDYEGISANQYKFV